MEIVSYIKESMAVENKDYDGVRRRLQDDQYVRLLHATLGLGSELGELLEITDGDELRIAEELGDILWFSVLAADALDKLHEESSAPKYSSPPMTWQIINAMKMECDAANPLALMSMKVEQVQTAVKGYLFYGKAFVFKELGACIADITKAVAKVGRSAGFTHEEIMGLNHEKLRGKAGRYKDGRFTAVAAIHRDVEAEMESMTKRKGRGDHGE